MLPRYAHARQWGWVAVIGSVFTAAAFVEPTSLALGLVVIAWILIVAVLARSFAHLRFWAWIAAALLVLSMEIAEIRAATVWWDVRWRVCGPNCVASGPPLSSGVLAVVYMAALLAVGVLFVWLAVPARRRGRARL